MSQVFTFNRLNDEDEQRAFLKAVEQLPKGPLRTTAKLQSEASDLLARAARDRAAKFGREQPNLDDHRRAMADNPALARVWAGDVGDERLAEVS